MIQTKGYAAFEPAGKLGLFNFFRRNPGSSDILIKIFYCGICHSDIHQVRNEWGIASYPLVPGHEMVGEVIQIGSKVEKFKVGDLAGVGCFVDSCRICVNCKEHEEQFCSKGVSWSYGGLEQDGKTTTYGGYSSQIVVDEKYALKIPKKFPKTMLANIAPLLCAGITTYSPLRQAGIRKGQKVAIVGLGGLGHMAVKLASSMKAEVTVLSSSKDKAKDARRLGARDFYSTRDPKTFTDLAGHFDFILDTVSAPHDANLYLSLLRKGGLMTVVGAPEKPFQVQPFSLIMGRKKMAGSLIGGIQETQAMLDYCAKHNITSDVEVIPIQKVDEAFDRTVAGKVHYRFVIDLTTLK